LNGIWGFGGGFDRSYPVAPRGRISTSSLHFVPKEATFFAGSALWPARNICSEAGLFPQPMGDINRRADRRNRKWKAEGLTMLSWVVTFLVVALIAGILGFGGIVGASVEIAKIIFFIAVVLFLISAVVGLARGRTRI
jgi:uncharacterized membrane protein YtjA (UPF0391 family)